MGCAMFRQKTIDRIFYIVPVGSEPKMFSLTQAPPLPHFTSPTSK